MPHDPPIRSRRNALRCLAYGGAGTVFALAGGVLTPIDLAAAADKSNAGQLGRLLFVQISDTHIGFAKPANPAVGATLARSIDLVNSMSTRPELIIHTGDITHLSKPEEFDAAQHLLSNLQVTELHTVPGEHDVADAAVSEYFSRFGKTSNNRGYYSFDHAGVHFIALINVLRFKQGGLGALGVEQLAWVEDDLRGRSASTPIVVFAHIPLWNVYEPWGWGTEDAPRLTTLLRRFGSVTILNGHIHQIIQKVEGNMTFHTARSTAYPQPAPGVGPGPGPLLVPPDQLPARLGITTVSLKERRVLDLRDTTLAQPRIVMRDFKFVPASLTVKAGTTVEWANQDDEPHTVTSVSGLFRSGAIDSNAAFRFRFDRRGTYQFVCSIHPRMVGTVVVQ